MGWDSAPPSAKELKTASDWADEAPSASELQGLGAAAPISELESALRGGAEGATFGLAPAIAGAADAAPQALGALTGSNSLQELLDTYRKSRDASKAKFKAAEEANPKSYLAGGLAGGLLPALATGGVGEAGAAAQGLSGLTKGLLSAKTAAGALTGAGYGALSGLGNAVSDGADAGDAAKSALANAAGGAALGGAASKVASALGAVPDSLDSFANAKALKATGISKGQLKNILKQDIKSNAYAKSVNPDAEADSTVNKIGNLLLSKNPYQDQPIVTAGSTPEKILERSQDLIDKSGKSIGDILGKLDKGYSPDNASFVNPTQVAGEVQKQLLDPLKVNGALPPVSEPLGKTIGNVIDSIKQYGDQPIPFEKAQQLKQLIANLTNYEQDGSAANQVLKRSGGIINNAIEDSASKVSGAAGDGLADQYQNAKDLYGAGQTALKASLGKTAGKMANNEVGLTDYLAGGIGAASHGLDGGIVAAGANKLAKTYGNSIAASGAKSLSNTIGTINSKLIGAPKEALSGFADQLVNNGGAIQAKLGGVLKQAADRDDIGRNALVFSLMQNPAYREILHKYVGGDEDSQK